MPSVRMEENAYAGVTLIRDVYVNDTYGQVVNENLVLLLTVCRFYVMLTLVYSSERSCASNCVTQTNQTVESSNLAKLYVWVAQVQVLQRTVLKSRVHIMVQGKIYLINLIAYNLHTINFKANFSLTSCLYVSLA